MGIEKLSTAARAAGFAMGTSDELLTSSPLRAVPDVSPWQSADVQQNLSAVSPRAVAFRSLKTTAVDLRKNVTAFLGWSAPA